MDEKGQDVATTVLVSEIDGATEQIKAAKYATCPAHEPMARGLVVLLQVARAQLLSPPPAPPIQPGPASGISAGGATAISAVVMAVGVGAVAAARAVGWLP
jgi:hypothetical protein